MTKLNVTFKSMKDDSLNLSTDIETDSDILYTNNGAAFYKLYDEMKQFENILITKCKVTDKKLILFYLTCGEMWLCEFENCNISYSRFIYASIKHSQFINCDMEEADFRLAHIIGTTFDNCKLDDAKFTHAHFTEVKFKNCDLRNIIIDEKLYNELKRNGCFENCTE